MAGQISNYGAQYAEVVKPGEPADDSADLQEAKNLVICGRADFHTVKPGLFSGIFSKAENYWISEHKFTLDLSQKDKAGLDKEINSLTLDQLIMCGRHALEQECSQVKARFTGIQNILDFHKQAAHHVSRRAGERLVTLGVEYARGGQLEEFKKKLVGFPPQTRDYLVKAISEQNEREVIAQKQAAILDESRKIISQVNIPEPKAKRNPK